MAQESLVASLNYLPLDVHLCLPLHLATHRKLHQGADELRTVQLLRTLWIGAKKPQIVWALFIGRKARLSFADDHACNALHGSIVRHISTALLP